MRGRPPKRYDCGQAGMLTAAEIALRAGIGLTATYQRISRGLSGDALAAPAIPSGYRHRGERYTSRGVEGQIEIAFRIGRAYTHRAPTVIELMNRYGMSRATAFRWRRLWLDAHGEAA